MPWRSIILMFSTGIFTIIQFLYQSFTSSLLEPDRPLPTVHTSNSGASRSMFICHPQSGEIYWRSFGLVAAFQIVVNHAKVPAALQQCSSNNKQGKFSLTWSISDLRLHSLHELVDYSGVKQLGTQSQDGWVYTHWVLLSILSIVRRAANDGKLYLNVSKVSTVKTKAQWGVNT